MINFSFSEGTFPEALKTARMNPAFKKEDRQLSSNYRPIYALSVFSKFYWKCMYSRLYSFLTKYNLLFKKQFNFRNKHSTNHAYISLTDLIRKYLGNYYFVLSENTLLVKLDFYSIRGLANSWLKLFFENIRQHVNLPWHSLSVKTITCGVAYGPTLGPSLFLIYVNDLQSVFLKSVVHYFADDTSILFHPKIL